MEMGLADEGTHLLRAAQAAQTGGGKVHGSSLRPGLWRCFRGVL
jgi:hypothetical protein